MQQPANATTPQPVTTKATLSEVPRGIAIVLILLISLTIITAGSFVSYAAIIHPMQIRSQATAVVNNIQTAQAQSSPQYLYEQITRKAPTFSDLLDGPRFAWQTDAHCIFKGGAYHIQSTAAVATSPCLETGHEYSNFLYQIQMTFVHGSMGGIVFRASGSSHLYAFVVSDNGRYLTYVSIDDRTGLIFNYNRSAAIKPGPNQPNLLAVLVRDSTINLYINKQFVASLNDKTLDSGEIGCAVNDPGQPMGDIAFNNAQVWNIT